MLFSTSTVFRVSKTFMYVLHMDLNLPIHLVFFSTSGQPWCIHTVVVAEYETMRKTGETLCNNLALLRGNFLFDERPNE